MPTDTPAPRPAPQAERWCAIIGANGQMRALHVSVVGAFNAATREERDSAAFCTVTVLPDTAPLPPDVVARALAQHEAEVKAAQWEHYKLGILHAAEFVQGAHRDHVVAAEIITHLLSGESLRSLKEQAKRAEVSFSWAEVERQCGLVRDRATPRPAPAGEVG